MHNKEKEYGELVKKRKAFKFTDLQNPSEIENGQYDTENEIGPWSLWQGNINADILVIGQDWGDEKYYKDNEGRDIDNNPTNKRLKELFKCINIDIGNPSNSSINTPVFFTNAILGIKRNGMSSEVKSKWVKESTIHFLKPLIEIINPKIIITLGKPAFNAIDQLYNLRKANKLMSNIPLKSLIEYNPFDIGGKKIFAFYHCGFYGTDGPTGRRFNLQKEDWNEVSQYI